jgi:hypothetical protein
MGGSGKWRARPMTEELWREYYIRERSGGASTRALTPEEEAGMATEVARSKANYLLRKFVLNFGWLLQYVAVFVVCWCGIGWTMEHARRPVLTRLYALPVLIAVTAGILAVKRGYFTSIAIGI